MCAEMINSCHFSSVLNSPKLASIAPANAIASSYLPSLNKLIARWESVSSSSSNIDGTEVET